MTSEIHRLKRSLFHLAYSWLNRNQREAVFTVHGPLLVVAGAGSGKTTVLANRIAFIARFGNAFYSEKEIPMTNEEFRTLKMLAAPNGCNNGDVLYQTLLGFADEPCHPSNILAITFTNKAANEIKERLSNVLGKNADLIWSGTFHSICVRLLRMFSDHTQYGKDFTIYDQDDCKKIISEILKQKNIEDRDFTPKYVLNVISNSKNKLETVEDFKERAKFSAKMQLCAEIYQEYQDTLFKANAMDFDDLLCVTVRMLQTDPDVLRWCQNKFHHVMVDEYQDTNHVQYLLMKLIGDGHRNVMVVGDDDQSIYKFRGADISNILDFDKQYPDATVITLEDNYRSTATIVEAANGMIAHNRSRRYKKLRSRNEQGFRPRLYQLADQEKEALFITESISEMVVAKGFAYRDIAILYRTRAQANALETVFTKSGVPHRLLSGLRFYDHAEVKDIISYLRVLRNPNDPVSLNRIINTPRRGIGQTTMQRAQEIAKQVGVGLYDVLRSADQYPELSKAASRLKDFTSLIDYLTDFSSQSLPSETVKAVLDRTGYMETLLGDENSEKRDNVNELISSALFYEEKNDEPSLVGFLEEIALVSDIDNYDEETNSVVMMTIHAAKGLEFPVVYLVGMEENLFPSAQSTITEEDIEEERRLAYVAMTRAKSRLFITCAYQRMLYGRTSVNPVSRFVREIPEHYIHIKLYEPDQTENLSYYADYTNKKPIVHRVTTFERRAPRSESDLPPKKPSAPLPVFSVGNRVTHLIFGDGTILSAKKYGSDVLYKIQFDKAGEKKLMATYAKLKLIQ